MLKVYHNSHDTFYREPFGAIELGESLVLRIRVESADNVLLRLWSGSSGEAIIPMSNEKDVYEATITPKQKEILWYYFIIELNGSTYYYSRVDDRYSGVGLLEKYIYHSFQITVYENYDIPNWYLNGVMY